jgi:chromosome segregation ATPase
MKKLGLIIALGLAFVGAPAWAADYRHGNSLGYVTQHNRLEYQINRASRLLGKVRWELRKTRGHLDVKREVARLSRELDRVKWQYRNRSGNHYRLSREIERIRRELDRIHDRLDDRGRDEHRGWDRD